MKLSELLTESGLDARACGDARIEGLTLDSRSCRAGSCFIAARGTAADGHDYITAAVEAGALAVVCERPCCVPEGVAYAVLGDSRAAAGPLAQAFRGHPARKLVCAGITGTNGKTTVAHMLRSMCVAAGHKAGMLGTVTYDTGLRAVPARNTTPDPLVLADAMAEMVASDCSHMVMEVSSHALDQDRTVGIEFAVGVFTNLSGDHLDYHGDMTRYLDAKAKLFTSLAPDATAVLNAEDPASKKLAGRCAAKTLHYGLASGADVWADVLSMNASGTRMTVRTPGSDIPVQTSLIGRHNVMNALAAAAAAVALGFGPKAIASALKSLECVPGRCQRIGCRAGPAVFVDYAHTDDALANVLSALRGICTGRLIVVFGCGGDRDRSKRPRMARTAEQLGDIIVVTSDNPRTECPSAIIEDILAGFSPSGRSAAIVEPDRRKAILAAVSAARAEDLVLIAGKGHEDYQIIGAEKTHFDDREVASEALGARGASE